MIGIVQEWGNSQGIRLPLNILKEAQIKTGQNVEISVRNNQIIVKKKETRKSIQELFADYEGQYIPETIDWGTPSGKEIW